MSSPHLSEELALLQELPVFEAFHREALQIVAFSSDIRSHRAGDTLFRQGQISDGGFLVINGSVNLEPATGAVSVVEAGQLIGAQALFAATERPATAIIAEPSRLMRIPRSLVLRVLETFPEIARALQQKVSGETQQTLAAFSQIVSVLNRSVEARDAA
jgi:CRP-like cAMP-binding protein